MAGDALERNKKNVQAFYDLAFNQSKPAEAVAKYVAKIEHAEEPTKSIKHGSAHLCIADPLGRRVSHKEGRLAELLGTHPPMSLRIAKLRAMAYQEMKRDGTFVPATG